MHRIVLLVAAILVVLTATGCVANFALAQEAQQSSTEPKPEAKSTEAQAEPKPEAEQGAEHKAGSSEDKKEEGEDAEAALKESAMVKKFGGMLGIKNPATAYWVFTIVNFAILALALGAGIKKVVPGAFRSRNASIQKSMDDARKASAEANTRLSEIQARLGRIDAEIASIRASAEEQGRAEEERLRAATEEDKKKILQAAEQEISAASAQAQRELKQFAAELAVSLAEKRISVSENTDRNLVREFTQTLGNGARGGKR